MAVNLGCITLYPELVLFRRECGNRRRIVVRAMFFLEWELIVWKTATAAVLVRRVYTRDIVSPSGERLCFLREANEGPSGSM